MTFSEASRDRFLGFLAETGNVTRSAEAISISRCQAYRWRNADGDFAADWDLALETARGLFRERIVETATALGLGHWVEERDPLTGEPVLDDELERVMRLEVSHVDARVLIKLLSLTVPAEVKRAHVEVSGGVTLRRHLDLDNVPMKQLLVLRELLEEGIAADAEDAEFEVLPPPDGD